MAEDVVEDYDAGLEYAEADCIVDMESRGDSRNYLIRCDNPTPPGLILVTYLLSMCTLVGLVLTTQILAQLLI